MQEKIDFLRGLPIFADFEDDELVDLARICDRFKFERGSVLAYQHDVADRMYIVRSGRLESHKVQNGVTTDKQVYTEGDWFQDTWLFRPGIHSGTVRASEDGEVWTIQEDEFLTFVEQHPHVVLDLSEAAWHELDHSRATATKRNYHRLNLSIGELVEYESRRSRLLLLIEVFFPLVAMVAAPLLSLWVARNIFNAAWQGPLYGLLAFVTLPFLGLALYRYFDWANDFLVITNKYLIHQDFNLRTFQGQITKIPLDQVQSVRTLRPNFIETQLGLGSVRITTASQRGGIVFDKLSHPGEVEKTLTKIRRRKRTINDSRTRSDARAVLERHFRVPDQIVEIKDDSVAGKAAAKERQRQRVRRRGDRVVVGDEITYGRHWIVLFRQTWWIVLFSFISIIVAGAVWVGFPAMRGSTFTIIGVVAIFIEAGVFYFFYEDWANDIFQVTSNMIIDIDRGPFGFTESRKTAQLTNVQNVRTDQPNFWSNLFDYGNVIIDTAGESAQITFENIRNPGRVQTDIFDRRDEVLRARRTRDANARRQELALMLNEYQQLREQEKIRPLTPVRDSSFQPNND